MRWCTPAALVFLFALPSTVRGQEAGDPSAAEGAPAEAHDESRDADRGVAEEGTRGGELRRRVGTEEAWADALPFRNSSITYENVISNRTIYQGDDLTYNPYYAMSVSLRPRWYFTDAFSTRLRFDVETELTNADNTTTYREPRVSDIYLDFVYDPIVKIPGVGVSVGAGLRFSLPTSVESRAQTRYLGIGPELRLARVFSVLDGLTMAYSFRYTKYINRQDMVSRSSNPYTDGRPTSPVGPQSDPMLEAAYFATPAVQTAGMDPHDHSGVPALSQAFTNTLMVRVDFLRRYVPMSFTVMTAFLNGLTYGVPEHTTEVSGTDHTVAHIADPTTHRPSIWYVVDLGVEITDFLSASVGASTLSHQLAPDATYRTPFFNRNTNLYVDLSLDVERFVALFRK
jgi:hypothetical protein